MAKEKDIPSTEGYIKKEDFIKIAIKCNCDKDEIVKYVISNGIVDNYDESTARRRLKSYREKGYLPLESGNKGPEEMLISKVSTYYGKDGEVRGQWVSAKRDDTEYLNAFKSAVTSIIENIKPTPLIHTPIDCISNCMSVYTIGDAHVGMLAWRPESGEDHDLEISIDRHIQAMNLLVAQANPTKEAFIVDVGDFFHSDNAQNRTSHSGNALDVDGRYAKVLEVGLRLTISLIDLALQKHEVVRWRSAIGN